MQEEKIKKYLIFTLLFQIIILFVGIVPTSSISIGDKLEIVILTNIGLLSGTIAAMHLFHRQLLGQYPEFHLARFQLPGFASGASVLFVHPARTADVL